MCTEGPRSPWSERFVDACDGTRLHTRARVGDGVVDTLLSDGIACDGFIWRYLVDDLLPDVRRLVHWNYRGHGRSGAPVDEGRVGLEAFVDDIDVVRGELEGPALLIGHSIGCQVVLEAYRRRPEGVAAMVLICGAAGRVTHTFKGSDALAKALPGLIERIKKNPRIARALWANVPPELSTQFALRMGEVDASAIRPEDVMAYAEHVANLDLLMFLRMLRDIGDATTDDMLHTVNVPTLVIAGELDTFTSPARAEEMAAKLPDSELMLVRGATHVVPVERRDVVRDRISSFIRERVVPSLGR